jgi:pseudouridine-5'-phosphate glycosidase
MADRVFTAAVKVRGPNGMVAVRLGVASGGTSAGIVAGAHGGCGGMARSVRRAAHVGAELEEMARATSAVHRAWVMDREIRGVDYDDPELFDEHPCAPLVAAVAGW